jgi:hypothetical protein
MQIQINTDNNISGQHALAQSVEDILRSDLNRFSDENSSAKSGSKDKRCLLEVRLAGERPIVTSQHAETIGEAVTSATEQMVHLLETELGKRGKK